jgi:hypothetical protein
VRTKQRNFSHLERRFLKQYLPIFLRGVLERIASGDEGWDEMVPPQVAEMIRQRGFFGYKKKD